MQALEELGNVLRQGFSLEGIAHTGCLASEDILVGAVASLVGGGRCGGVGGCHNFPAGGINTFSGGLRKSIALRAVSLSVNRLGAGNCMGGPRKADRWVTGFWPV